MAKATYVLLAPSADERSDAFQRAGTQFVGQLTIVRLLSVDDVQGTCEVRIPARVFHGEKMPAETAIVDIGDVYGRQEGDRSSLDFVLTQEHTLERIVEVQARVVLTGNHLLNHRNLEDIVTAHHRQDPKVHQHMVGLARAYGANGYIANLMSEYLEACIQPF